MKTISIRDLHARTGYWVRLANQEGPIAVTDRGRRVAILADSVIVAEPAKAFPRRDRARLPATTLDSTSLLSEDRAR